MLRIQRALLVATQQFLSRAKRRVDRLLVAEPSAVKRLERTLAHAYETGWQDYPCVFVLSTGRCGTETLTALTTLSPRLVGTHEPRPRLIHASYQAHVAGRSLAASQHWRDVVLASRDDAVWAAGQKGTVYVETNNRLTFLAPVLAEVFPASRFIHLYREPFAFVRSAMRRRYYSGHNWDFARVRPRPGEPLAEEWGQLPSMDRCSWLWSHVNGEAQSWLATLPIERRLTLKAEDMFAGRDETLQRLFAFCGSDVPPAEQIREVLGGKMNAQTHGEFPVASEWNDEQRERVWGYVGDVATRLGYEQEQWETPERRQQEGSRS